MIDPNTPTIIYHYENIKNIESAGYCGQTINKFSKRNSKHMSKENGCIKFKEAIDKYGKDAFVGTSIMTIPNWAADWFERYWIFWLGCVEYGYNLSPGGNVFYPTEESNKKNSDSHDKVKPQCIETGIIYDSLSDMQKRTGISKADVSHCIKDPNRFYTAGDYHWRKAGDTITIEQIESGRKFFNKYQPVLIDQKLAFPSKKKAAEYYGISVAGMDDAILNNRKCKGHWYEYITKDQYNQLTNNNANGESLSC